MRGLSSILNSQQKLASTVQAAPVDSPINPRGFSGIDSEPVMIILALSVFLGSLAQLLKSNK